MIGLGSDNNIENLFEMVLLIISYWTSFAQISRLQWIRKFGVLGTGVRENEINYALQ